MKKCRSILAQNETKRRRQRLLSGAAVARGPYGTLAAAETWQLALQPVKDAPRRVPLLRRRPPPGQPATLPSPHPRSVANTLPGGPKLTAAAGPDQNAKISCGVGKRKLMKEYI